MFASAHRVATHLRIAQTRLLTETVLDYWQPAFPVPKSEIRQADQSDLVGPVALIENISVFF
jgi:hypothetical protein